MPEDASQKRYNHILNIIDERLIPDKEAKQKRGEVFTPLNLVREMLFGIRKSSIGKAKPEIWGFDVEKDMFIDEDEKDRVGGIPLDVWRNPKSTFLDPANGIGNFPVVAFYMLDYQLGKHGKSVLYKGTNEAAKKRRREHIVKNMLYMIELNKGNVNTSRKIFEKLAPGVKANICCANTLQMTDEKLKREFGINRFDVIMGNPPYQDVGKSGDNKLYLSFITFSNKLLKYDTSKTVPIYGYLIFVVPSTSLEYLKLEKNKDVIDKKYNIIFINNAQKYLKSTYFPSVGSTFVYFLYNNDIDHYTNTTLLSNSSDNKLEIREVDFFTDENLSSIDKEIFDKIFDTEINYKFNDFKFPGTGKSLATRRIRKEHIEKGIVSKNETSVFKYKIIDTINKTVPWPPKKGNYYYFDKKDIDYDKDKIVFSAKGYLMPTLDTTHNWTYSDSFKYILCDDDCDKLLILFKSPLIDYIINRIKTSGFASNSLFDKLSTLKKIDLDTIKNNSDIYSQLKIEKYREHIEKVAKTVPTGTEGGSRKINKKTIGKTRKLKRN